MLKRICLYSLFLSIMLTVFLSTASAQISVIPNGIGVSLDENDEGGTELILINDYEDAETFSIDYDLIEDDEDRRNGPQRDEPGELLREFESPLINVGGMCFDGELLWGGDYGNNRIAAVTLEGEEILNFVSNNNPLSMTFDGEIIWASNWSTAEIYTYDLEGERIDQFNVGFNSISGMASDRDQYVFMNCNNDQRIHVISIEDREEVTTFAYRAAMGNQDVWGIEWVPDHPEGQLWGNAQRHVYQAYVDEEWNVEAVSDFAWNTVFQHTEPAHDGENLWHGSWAESTWFMYDDGVSEFNMLTFDPEEGEIPGEDSIPVEVFITTEGVEAGVYNVLVSLETDREMIEFSIVVTVDSPSALVTCIVEDAETEEPLQDITVDVDMYNIQRNTDENGICDFEELPTGDYEFIFTADDYLPLVEEYGIDGEGELVLEAALLHSECNPSEDNFNAALEQDEILQTELIISNGGNGPLTYTTDRRLLGDANADPWELRVDVPVGVIAQDPRIHGTVFINDHFYLSGANDREPVMYVLNRDQELIDQYDQLGEGRYGYKDLASDGEIIWGSGERNIYGFTPDGEEVVSFDSGISPCNNLAYDSDRDVLWISGTTTDVFAFDREGNSIIEIDRQDLRIYGLAYWPDDPDGYQLYIFHKINEVGDLLIAKVNIENSDMMDVVSLEHEAGGVAQGCFITNQYDIYSWVFMGIANNGAEDRIDIWQIDARKDWMSIEPTEGIIEAEEEQEFVITLDATELPEAIFEGEIVFMHDGVGSETIIGVTLEVGDGGEEQEEEEMNLVLMDGWNMVSAYVQPDPDNVVDIMSELVEADQLILMKNGAGRFYNPAFNFNNIPGWLVNEGYMVKADGEAEMTISGNSVDPDEPLPLIQGWQISSYYPRLGVDAVTALSGIVDVLLMAKDAQGRFYNPEFNFSNMGEMVPGQGYLLKLDEAAELIYTVEEELARQSSPFHLPSILPVHQNTGENMSLLVLSDISTGEIGVYANGILAGSGVIQNGKCGIAVWGDDTSTKDVDGALKGDMLEYRYQNGSGLQAVEFETVMGENKYSSDGFHVIRIQDITVSPIEFGIVDVYPNPFNSSTSITYNLLETADIKILLFDLDGRLIANLLSNHSEAGSHSLSIDGSVLTSGIYLVQIEAGSKVSQRKLILLK
ncbi:MAG: T9SS type A sorting domain-containing protein [Calditrichaeota bacterium]|nr:T9SS type A sorting domain-containing protein [Calditrichota bacterium]